MEVGAEYHHLHSVSLANTWVSIPEIIWPHKAGCRNSNDNIAIPLEKAKGLNDSDNIHSHLLNIQNPISFPMHVI